MTDPATYSSDPNDPSDPFGERQPQAFSRVLQLLGCSVEFHGNSPQLMELVDEAYAGLPAQAFGGEAPRLQVQLQLTHGPGFAGLVEPPPARMQGGAGMLGALMDSANFAIACPATRRGLVCISEPLLQRFRYHARYELLEFAVFTLATRAQDLAPLHAACVGRAGRGVLLIGESGAGKSTLALQCLRQGLDFLTEDASFVAPRTLQATGVANFLHLRADSLAFLDDDAALLARIRASTVIRRRSGVEKFELDLRGERLASAPLQLGHVVFVSKEATGGGGALRPLAPAQMLARLQTSQPYAVGLPSWSALSEKIAHLPAFELLRCPHPRDTARALATLLPP